MKVKNNIKMSRLSDFFNEYGHWVLLFTILAGLCLTSFYNFLLFHSLAEIFAIVIIFSIFFLAWNTRDYTDNYYLLFIGISLLFAGVFEILHMLAYKGMGIFNWNPSNLPTQLWIASHYLIALTFLAGTFFTKSKPKTCAILIIYSIITILLILSIFYWRIFPDCYIEGSGLTTFKKISEYAISFVFLLCIIQLFRRRADFDDKIFKLLISALFFFIVSEISFTFYISVYGISNLIGHLLMVVSFYLIYKAVIETSLRRPFSLLFRNLKNSEAKLEKDAAKLEHVNERLREEMSEREKAEEKLREHKDNLEKMVIERTNELTDSYHQLELEIAERSRAENELRTLSNRIIEMQEEERKLISQDLHDQVGQSLTVLNLMLARIKNIFKDKQSREIADITEAQGIVTELIQQIRNISTSLHPSMLDNIGLVPTLEWYIKEFSKRTSIDVNLHYYGDESELTSRIKLTVYRVIQESLTNIARHADVEQAEIELLLSGAELQISVTDKGKGFNITEMKIDSSGIRGMRERVRAAGGTMHISSYPGKGTSISFTLPLKDSAQR
jgi:signal transduction histidine kinase